MQKKNSGRNPTPEFFFIRMVQSKFREYYPAFYGCNERLRWLGHALRKKDDILPKIVIFDRPSRAKQKAGHLRVGWEIS